VTAAPARLIVDAPNDVKQNDVAHEIGESPGMEFVASPEIFAAFPGLRLAVAVARGIENRAERPEVATLWAAEWHAAAGAAAGAAAHGNAQSHPRVRPWREHFTAPGVSGKQFPSSIEALLRRALKGGEPFRINPLVDWYNALSLRHVVPAGGFDLAAITGPLELRLTRPGDTFAALDATEAEPVPPGEIAYADGQTVLTRHFVWRQARAGLIAPDTHDVFLVSEILGEVGPQVADAMLRDLREGLEASFGVGAESWLLDAERRSVTW
jgi:DNA/RNA-binding domain of Phe-tRNA-synthetase-like protein